MNVAIIGSGYVGTKIAQHLSYSFGCTITMVVESKQEFPEVEPVAQQEVVITDNNEASLQSVLKKQDAVILSFPRISADRQLDVSGDEEIYLHTAKNLVEALKQTPSVKQLIFTSSCAVYGRTDGQWVNEDSPVTPNNKEAKIVSQIEKILLQASSEQLKVCILRLGQIYGLGRELKDYSSLCGQTLPGTGENFTNWIHVDDITSVAGFIIQNKLQGIYNLVDDVPIKSGDLLEQVCKSYGLANVEWDFSIDTNRPNVRVSNQKLKSVGYRFTHTEVSVLD